MHMHDTTYDPPTPTERFWNFVNAGPFVDCWEWTGALRNGYGVLNVDGKVVYAHRFSYELHNGPIEDGMCVLHKCDHRKCCNPYHLFAGTQGDNIRDMYRKGRGNTSNNIGTAKLTPKKVQQIRKLAAQDVSYTIISEQFGVTKSNISYIVNRKRWKHVP